MTVAVYVPLLLGVPLWWVAPRMARHGSPALTAWALAVIAVVAAAATTWSLSLLALTLFDDLPPWRALGADPSRQLPTPVPDPIAAVAVLLLIGAAVRLLTDARRRLTTVHRLRTVGTPHDGVAIADLPEPMAVAVPGRPGHILVTTAMLHLLDHHERQVMFAHERAHLRHRHHTLVLAAAMAAAINPLLIPAREAVTYLVERWADEDAAAAVGDRGLAARAIARAGLATVRPGPSLAVGGGPVVRRVQALTGPAPRPHRRRLAGLLALLVTFGTAATIATAEFVAVARAWL
ncbi:M56 family metallopeptidase [Actinoplanes sp. NPDC051411]|uniref:M56 family metallopeptidase n=1 Tax=Actinoplanes sp. NPDC051411 TaxID=3155522 RepID=UPI00341E817B